MTAELAEPVGARGVPGVVSRAGIIGHLPVAAADARPDRYRGHGDGASSYTAVSLAPWWPVNADLFSPSG